MSDIAIRFDGLLLGLTMATGVLLFATITTALAIRAAMIAPGPGRWRLTILSAWLTASQTLGLMIAAVYVLVFLPPQTGKNWIDWLALPWCGFLGWALILLLRARHRA